jgi:NAD(P)-dependent dehydrogenase (short-subunit alcohol dehydrogenase family)
MADKVALVTGASGGLGNHVTQALLDAGFVVIGLAPKIQQSDFSDTNFVAFPAEISSLAAAKAAVGNALARFEKIDVLAHLVGGFVGGRFRF